jgi:Tfp pilus assembly protein PilW
MNRIKDEAGLTLVELLVTITLMAIIGTTIVGFSFGAFRSYTSTNNSTREMQKARLAMEYIVRELRVAKSATITNSNTITYQSWSNDTYRTIFLAADNYLYLNDGTTNRAIIRSAIQGLTCNFDSCDSNNRIMDITIAVSDSTSLTSSVTMLNKD